MSIFSWAKKKRAVQKVIQEDPFKYPLVAHENNWAQILAEHEGKPKVGLPASWVKQFN